MPRGMRAGTAPDPADLQAVAEARFAQQELYAPTGRRAAAAPNSYEALAASLPPSAGPIEQDEDGNWVRYVPVTVGTVRDANGVVYDEVADTPRYIALTQEDAQTLSRDIERLYETDWWHPGLQTWFRRGYKPERDIDTFGRLRQPNAQRNVRRVRADAGTQALAERDDLRRAAAAPLIPRAASGELVGAGQAKE